jgi:ubiquinone/menaquinone biosynthesis C-methylase UbiE
MAIIEPSATEVFLSKMLGITLLSPFYSRFVDQLGLQGNEKVLDYGSGPGIIARHIARRLNSEAGRVTCVDISRSWLKSARGTLKRYPHVTFHLGTLDEIPLQEGKLDVVVIHFVLHDVEARMRPRRVRQLAKALCVGGRIVIREPTAKSHGMPAEEIRTLMAESGLKEVQGKEAKPFLIGPTFQGTYTKV